MNKRATYHNRYRHINWVVNAIGEFGVETATQIAPLVNLSRQAVLDILKHAETWGYVYHKDEPYRYKKDGTILVSRKLWYATEYGLRNAGWYVKAVKDAQAKGGQLPLL